MKILIFVLMATTIELCATTEAENITTPNEKEILPNICGPNERFAFCRSCERTCPGISPVPCSSGCSLPQCYCDPDRGFVRDQSGSCVKANQCPGQCAPNEVHIQCRTCEGRCGVTQHPCPLVCRGPGCECPFSDGYVRDSSNNCISSSQCPMTTRRTSTTRRTPPLRTCAQIICPPGERCVMVQVYCFRLPCSPIPECIPRFPI